jgi:hypothetical protein
MKTVPAKNVPRVEKPPMPTSPESAIGLDHFFSAVSARDDRWRDLAKAAQAWTAKGAASPLKVECARRLEQLRPFESLQAFPGTRLIAALEERVSSGDAQGTLRLVQRVISALMTRGYRSEAGEWEADEESAIGERVMPPPHARRPRGPTSRPCSSRPRRSRAGPRRSSRSASCVVRRTSSCTSR